MKEVFFVPESHVVSQAQMVSDWVRESEPRFNTALRIITKVESGEHNKEMIGWYNEGFQDNGYREDAGHQIINGERMLTGDQFCVEGSIAYGLALQRFPFVKDLRFLEFRRKHTEGMSTHAVLGFSIEGQDFFLDSTYGQVELADNTVKMDRLENIDNYYKITPFREIRDKGWTSADVFDRIDGKFASFKFEDIESLERGVNNVPPFGISQWEYLLSILDDQSKFQNPAQGELMHLSKNMLPHPVPTR